MALRPFLRRYLFHPLQALAGYALYAVMQFFPIAVASAMGGWLGRTIGPRLAISRRARRNLERAFPEKAAAEIETIVRDMWDNLGRTTLEYPLLSRLGEERVEIVGGEQIEGLRGDGRPGIFVSGHFANWEVTPLTLAMRNFPIHIFYRAPNNPYVETLFRQRAFGAGQLIPKGPKGARQALKVMADGGHLGVLADQKMNDGIAVPFFGRDAMTAPALAQLALKFDCPMVPARPVRIAGARFRVTYYPPIAFTPSGNRAADVAAIMTEVNRIFESWIRERPAEWLWLHNRWPD